MEDWVLESLARLVGSGDLDDLPDLAARCLEPADALGIPVYRGVRNDGALGRGLVVTRQGVIPDYARVRRVFHLTNAITKYYYSPFYIEEQVPGYHVRLARLGDRIVGLLRDGRACPFSSDRFEDLVPTRILEERPDVVVCLTVTGHGIPYPWAAPDGEGDGAVGGGAPDVEARVIDLMEWNVREPMTTGDKYELADEYGLPLVDHVGPFTAAQVDEVDAWLRDLDTRGGTGAVLKPSERHHRPLKFATPSALLRPPAIWQVLGRDGNVADPLGERLVRAACAAAELGADRDRWDWDALGRGLLEPVLEAVAGVTEGRPLRDERTVWLHDRTAAAAVVEHLAALRPDVGVERLGLDEERGGWRLRLAVTWDGAAAELRQRLSGSSYLS